MPSIIFIAVDISKSNDPKIIESYPKLCWSYIKKVNGYFYLLGFWVTFNASLSNILFSLKYLIILLNWNPS